MADAGVSNRSACLVRDLQFAHERGEVGTADTCCSFYHPMFEESLKTALREICDAVGSPS